MCDMYACCRLNVYSIYIFQLQGGLSETMHTTGSGSCIIIKTAIMSICGSPKSAFIVGLLSGVPIQRQHRHSQIKSGN